MEKESLGIYKKILAEMNGTEELMTNDHCSKISMMDGESAENIYLIILHYFVTSNKGHKQILLDGKDYPYSSKIASKDGKGLNFKVAALPDDLQRIIVRYLKMLTQ